MNKFNVNAHFPKHCRICAKESKYLRCLLDVTSHGKTIAELINICTQVPLHEDESKPNCICMSCMTKLNTAYEFHNLVKNCDQLFDELFSKQSFLTRETYSFDDYIDVKPIEKHEVNPIALRPVSSKPVSFYDDSKDFYNNSTESVFIEEKKLPTLRNKRVNTTKNPNALETLNVLELFERRDFTARKSNISVKGPKRHASTSIEKVNAKYECYICKKSFSALSKVRAHFTTHDNAISCRICMKKCTNYEYIQHLCKGHDIQCEYCSQSFTTIPSLIKHININHKDHRHYKCSKCAKRFQMKILRDIHKPVHGEEEKNFVCDICNRRFRTRYQIREHIETEHTDRRCKYFVVFLKRFHFSFDCISF